MRRLLALALVGLWAPTAWAKVTKVPKGAIEVNQLHDELLATFPDWRGTQRPDGTFTNPRLRVESTDQDITLTMPDEVNEKAVQSVVASHVPKPHTKKAPTGSLEERVSRIETLLGLR